MARLLIATWIAVLLFPLPPLHAAVIHVPGDQPTIQAAIDAAVDGDTVLVGPGTYYESIDIREKGIVLRSMAGPEQTIIHGSDQYYESGVFIGPGPGPEVILEGFTITEFGGGGVSCLDSSPTITNNIISNNGYLEYSGGYWYANGHGISATRGSPTISNNTISHNTAGGGIQMSLLSSETDEPLIIDNWIYDNFSWGGLHLSFGGGISAGPKAIIIGNVIEENETSASIEYDGGGGVFGGGLIEDNLFINNHATFGDGLFNCNGTIRNNLFVQDELYCGASYWTLYYEELGDLVVERNTLGRAYFNTTDEFPVEITNSIIRGVVSLGGDTRLNLSYSNLVLGESSIVVSGDATYEWGPGNISANPGFEGGPMGNYYLSQIAAGQAMDSPCLDAGDPAAEYPLGVTRTDGYPDSGIIDIGYHYPALGIVVGPGPSELNPPLVRVLSQGDFQLPIREFAAYGAPSYGVNVACGNFIGDSALEIITGPGPGDIYGPHVRGFQADGTPIQEINFMAYGTLKFGVNVALGNLGGGGRDEIITGAGPGEVFGPHVRAFSYSPESGITALSGVSFFAYATLKWGVNVTAGDIDGDGFDEIVTGPGPGAVFGPHVRGWNVDDGTAEVIPNMGFMAYGTWKYGVNVCCADVNGDGVDEMITAPGPSSQFGAHIRGWRWDGQETTPLPGFSFFAWDPAEARYGARVGKAADIDFNGRDEFLVTAGPDPNIGSPAGIYRYVDDDIEQILSFDTFPAGWTHGSNATAGWLR